MYAQRGFSEQNLAALKDYLKLSIWVNLTCFRKTNLGINTAPGLIAKSVVEISCSLYDSHKVNVSNSIIRNCKFNRKGTDVNENLKQLGIKKNLFLTDNTETVKVQHLILISSERIRI